MPRAYLIFNPAAGRLPPEILVNRASHTLTKGSWQVTIKPAKNAHHITQLAQQAAMLGMDAVFIAGGDGSVNRAAAGLINTHTALAVLPAGTANVWAQELKMRIPSLTNPTALVSSAKSLIHGRFEVVDIGVCNQKPFLLWCGIGLDAVVVHKLETRRKRWKKLFAILHYTLTTIQTARSLPELELKINIDGQTIENQYMLAVVSNIRKYAGGLAKLSPKAQLNDGVMELWLFSGKGLLKTLSHAWNLWLGNHVNKDEVTSISFQRLSLKAKTSFQLQMDGEPVQKENCLNINVKQKALNVLIPTSAPEYLFARD